jgi:four helix bundle protein
MKVEKIEDRMVWQEGMALATDFYELLKQYNDYGFGDQITRASLSVPSNIALRNMTDTRRMSSSNFYLLQKGLVLL